MKRPRTVSDSIAVPVDPPEIYDLIADPTPMSRWSPENTGATTTRPGPLQVGDRFLGTNTRGFRRGPSVPLDNASWEYRFAPVWRTIRTTLERLRVEVDPTRRRS